MKIQAYVLEFKYGLTLDTLREKRVIGKIEDGGPFSEYIKKDFLLTNNIEGLYTLNGLLWVFLVIVYQEI